MTAPLRELATNFAFSSLDGGINDSTTTVSVVNGSVFPSTGNFRLIIDSEIMLATARSGNNLTVTRGIEGTVAASHSNGIQIQLVPTAGGLDQFGKDNYPLWSYRPALHKIVADNGSTILTESDFTKVNQEGATYSDQSGTILVRCPPSSGTDLRVATRTAPSTPYTYIAGFQACLPLEPTGIEDAKHFGLGFRDSSGKLVFIMFVCQGQSAANGGTWHYKLQVRHWDDPNGTSFVSVRAEESIAVIGDVVWLKVTDNGTNTLFYVSVDGVNWIEIFSESRTAFFTGGPEEVCWYGQNRSDLTDALIRLVHWSRE